MSCLASALQFFSSNMSARNMIKYGLSWACGSIGRALAWHARGWGFESPQVHKICEANFILIPYFLLLKQSHPQSIVLPTHCFANLRSKEQVVRSKVEDCHIASPFTIGLPQKRRKSKGVSRSCTLQIVLITI